MDIQIFSLGEVAQLENGFYVVQARLQSGEKKFELWLPVHALKQEFSQTQSFFCNATDFMSHELHRFYYYWLPGIIRVYFLSSSNEFCVSIPPDVFKAEIERVTKSSKFRYLEKIGYFVKPELLINV